MEQFLEVEGLKIALKTAGNPRDRMLLMLHGWGGTKESWDPLTDAILESAAPPKRFFLAVDLPGFGKSDKPAQAWGVLEYAQFLEKFLKRFAEKHPTWCGYDLMVHSFGGRMLFKLLSPNYQHLIKERPGKLVLIAAAGLKPRRTLRLILAAFAAKIGKAVLRLPLLSRLAPFFKKVLYRVLKTHDYEESDGVMRDTFLKVINEDLQENFVFIKNPTLIFWGKNDTYVPLRDGKVMQEKIIGSELVVFSDGKHGIHKTKATQIAEKLSQFLQTSHGG